MATVKKKTYRGVSYDRFKRFLLYVKTSRTDKQILEAGHELVEAYRGFKYQHVSDAARNTIKKMVNKKGMAQV